MTTQAQAANMAWLPYAPPPTSPAAVCLVDTGVDLNADLVSAVSERFALDGGDPSDLDPNRHGTRMAMFVAAAVNDAGMVGAAPAVRVVSVRVVGPPSNDATVTVPFDAYRQAIRDCVKRTTSASVRVIELALGAAAEPTAAEAAALQDQVVKAHQRGISIVAGAGNDGGAVESPASADGVLAVGAAQPRGELCAFSARGPGLEVLAPGCALDAADPVTLEPTIGAAGTSQASAIAAGVLAALRAYKPELSWVDAEQALRDASSGTVLDVGRLFRTAGLGDVVDAGVAATPSSSPAAGSAGPSIAQEAPRPAPVSSPAVPALRPSRWSVHVRSVRWRRPVLTVRLLGVPSSASVGVQAVRGRGPVVLCSAWARGGTVRLRCRLRPSRVRIMYVDLDGRGRNSATRELDVP